MKWLDKIRAWPEWRKKLLVWTIILLGAVGLGWWWVRDSATRLAHFNPQKAAQEFNIQKLHLPQQ